jgi:very-short-patch-repair endonuclease
LTRNAVAARVAAGRLHRVHRGVYALGHGGLTMRGRFLAAVKACGEGAALSHVSAAALWEFLPYDEARPPDVIARGKRRIPGINTHRTRNPPPTIRYDDIPVTTPQRTLIDLTSVLPFKPLRRAVREALVRKRITADEATRIVRGGDQPTRSSLEDAVLDQIQAAGLPAPQVNQPFGKYVPDFRWPHLHLILEADGAAYHDNPLSRADDARRQAELEAQGERVLRVSYKQIRGSPGTGPAPTA